MPSTEEYCPAESCMAYGRDEFCGYCQGCWIGLDEEDRRVLSEKYVPDQAREVIERVRVIYPAETKIKSAIGFLWLLWMLAMTAAVAWLWMK